jgi:hypothetical protein
VITGAGQKWSQGGKLLLLSGTEPWTTDAGHWEHTGLQGSEIKGTILGWAYKYDDGNKK